MRKTTIYFGRNITWPDGTEDKVSNADWLSFLKEVVDKNYEGYTWYNVHGQWKGEHEATFALVIIHEIAYEESCKIEDIAKAYKDLFHQEAVLVEFTDVQTIIIE